MASHKKGSMSSSTNKVIKKGPCPPPQTNTEKKPEGYVSTIPLDIDNYTDEQREILQLNEKAKDLLYNAICSEAYAKISICKTAKEIWDTLEVTHDGTNMEKEARINSLVHKYEVFQMKEGESIENTFARFNKIFGDLKYFGRPYTSGEKIRKILRSLPIEWHVKAVAIECRDLDKLSYDEFCGDLIAFEITHLQRHRLEDKKKGIAFKSTLTETKSEDGDENQDDLAVISRTIAKMIRRN